MSFLLTGVEQEMARLRQHLRAFEKQAVLKVKEMSIALVEELFKGTPVWEGETVRNYGVRVAGSAPTYRPAVGTMAPGPTNSMPLGPEPRRAGNQAAAMADVMAALARVNKLMDVTVVNTVDDTKWDLIENGSAPTKELARYPGVVSVLARQRAQARVGDFK